MYMVGLFYAQRERDHSNKAGNTAGMGKLAQSCFGLGILLTAYGVNFSAAYAQESPKQIGYYCGHATSTILDGQYYVPDSSACYYESSSLGFGFRYGNIYKGVIGSSTPVTSHSLGFVQLAAEFSDAQAFINRGVQQGDDVFVAIYLVRTGPFEFDADVKGFHEYFQGLRSTPPNNNYGFVRFKYGVEPPKDPDPVIIIPGILGSEQYKGEWVIDPILHTYDDLIATLDVNGYTPDVDLFTFPYNWRKSNVETAVLLKEKIDVVKGICDCDKVDLVAHSMGGLVARQYIQSDSYENDVDQLIFLGTPHLGAPKAYLMWEGGEMGPFFPISEAVMENILEQEAHEYGYENLFAYIHNAPIDSVKELLPVYSYIFDGILLRDYPEGYPTNSFLEMLNANINQLYMSDVEIHNYIGDVGAQSTIGGIQATDSDEYLPMWESGYPEGFYSYFGDHGLVRVSGDRTVPLASASFILGDLTILPSAHDTLPFASEGEVYRILTGKEAVVLSDDFGSLDIEALLIKILSPADLLLIDPDGKRIGRKNGEDVNEIAGAFYTGFDTNNEYITILNPIQGDYEIITVGTGEGSYTVEVNYINEATTTTTSFTGSTNPGLMTSLLLSMGADEPWQMEIIPEDIEPPHIAITTPEERDYLRSEVLNIDIAANDETGVLSLQAELGTTTVQNSDTIDLFFQKLGVHTLTASSSDLVGNATSTTRAFRIVATTESTLSDIERAYALGWMTDENRKHLINKIEKVLSVEEDMRQLNPDKDNYQKKLQNLHEKFVKVLSSDFMRELDKQRGRGMAESAYQLLKEDIAWLINC